MRQQAVDGSYEKLGNNRIKRKHHAATREPKPASVIVDKTLTPLLLKGTKTQIRVPGIQQYEAGKVYAVRVARGRPKRCDVEAVHVGVQRLGDISFAEARAEGHRSRDEFFDEWARRYGDAEPEQTVTVLVVRVWSDTPRLLTPSARPRGTDTGYTDDPNMAMRDEPEALTPGQLHSVAEWRPALAEQRRLEPLQDAAERIKAELDSFSRELRTSPDRQVKSSVRAMQHQLSNIQARLGNKAA